MRGGTIKGVIGELLGRQIGMSHGKGGSMHIFTPSFFGGNGIVGAQVPVGAGLAFAQKYLGKPNATFALYGDGASNQGQVFEAFNMVRISPPSPLFPLSHTFTHARRKKTGKTMGPSVRLRVREQPIRHGHLRGAILVQHGVLHARGHDPGDSGERDGHHRDQARGAVRAGVGHVREGTHVVGVCDVSVWWAFVRFFFLLLFCFGEGGLMGLERMSDPGTTYRTREEVQRMRSTKDPIKGLQRYLEEWGLATEQELKVLLFHLPISHRSLFFR
jgi:pyruvate dehydrogenase E1 component alpha subunit